MLLHRVHCNCEEVSGEISQSTADPCGYWFSEGLSDGALVPQRKMQHQCSDLYRALCSVVGCHPSWLSLVDSRTV